MVLWDRGESYLRIKLIDLLNCQPNITRVNSGPYLNTFLDRIKIRSKLDVGLNSKFLRSTRVSVGDEVVHDKVVYITANHY